MLVCLAHQCNETLHEPPMVVALETLSQATPLRYYTNPPHLQENQVERVGFNCEICFANDCFKV